MNEQIISDMLECLVIIPAGILCFLPMKRQMRHSIRSTLLKAIPVFLALSAVLVLADLLTSAGGNAILFPILFICFAFYARSVKASVAAALSIFVDVMALISLLANFAASFDAARHPDLGINSSSVDYSVFLLVSAAAVTIILGFFFDKYGSALVDRLLVPKVWLMTLPFSGCILVIDLLMRPLKYETFHVNRVGSRVVIILAIVLLVWVVMNVVFYFIISTLLDAAKAEQERKILKMQEKQYSAQIKYINDSARARHDFRQTLRTLKKMADNGDAEAISAYLSAYIQELPSNETIMYCKNHALNAVLNYYAAEAKKEDLDISFRIDIGGQKTLADVELCTMIGNLLENAVAAASEADGEDRFIELSMAVQGGHWLYIVETNGFGGNINLKNGIYSSTKRGGSGLGTPSIKSSVEHYGGSAEFSHQGNEFYVNIAIPVSED
ncbi:MAG: sensor histidine kinase [Anaerovoracaceae bacterium]|jgi:two-component system sensor histidine kinase AgrC